MIKRIALFIGTNILVIATISIVINLLGLHGYLSAYGINYQQLALFCLVWGMTGSIISLLISKFIAKIAMGVVIIQPKTATRDEKFLVDIVSSLSRKAGLPVIPEIGIYHSPELNAFATGPSKRHALVAVSSGLLANMNEQEMTGVLGHEITHIANGDMVTMTLIQGVVNAFAMFLSRIIAFAISTTMARSEERDGNMSYGVYYVCTFIFDLLFTILGSLLVAAFSRWREYRADKGGARLAGKDSMIAALQRLQHGVEVSDDRAPSLAALKISHPASWLEWFSSHPPLEKRIARLRHSQLIH